MVMNPVVESVKNITEETHPSIYNKRQPHLSSLNDDLPSYLGVAVQSTF